jgi:hypothetical protein
MTLLMELAEASNSAKDLNNICIFQRLHSKKNMVYSMGHAGVDYNSTYLIVSYPPHNKGKGVHGVGISLIG